MSNVHSDRDDAAMRPGVHTISGDRWHALEREAFETARAFREKLLSDLRAVDPGLVVSYTDHDYIQIDVDDSKLDQIREVLARATTKEKP